MDVTKEELTKMVWSMPIMRVARELGVSDPTIHKLCNKLEVEKPPRGYWTKERRTGVAFDKAEYCRDRMAREYEDFKVRRQAVYVKLGGECYCCERQNVNFHLHHLTYGKESDYPRNSKSMSTRWKRLKEAESHPDRFRLLCPTCHKMVHMIEMAIASGSFDRLVDCIPT